MVLIHNQIQAIRLQNFFHKFLFKSNYGNQLPMNIHICKKRKNNLLTMLVFSLDLRSYILNIMILHHFQDACKF